MSLTWDISFVRQISCYVGTCDKSDSLVHCGPTAHYKIRLYRRLRLYPRGRATSPGQVIMTLTCTGTQPEHFVNYQLVLQNQDNTEKSVAIGG